MQTNRAMQLANLACALVLTMFTACGPLELPDDDDSGKPTPDPTPRLIGGQSLSWHYIEVVFDRAVGTTYANPDLYIVKDANNETLEIKSARLQDNPARVLLETAPQRQVQYELTLAGSAGQYINESGEPVRMIVVFKGSTQAEPYVASAIALSPTSVLVTYGGGMDDNIGVAAYYEIAHPDLDVLTATPGAGNTTALLTTSEQENIDYTLRVTNVTSNNGSKLIDPTRSTVTFNGIAPDEPPVVTGAAAINATTVLVSFNKPLADDAADPTRFSITPDLTVTTAQASLFNTQIKLTTLPMTAGQTYTVIVTGVKDRGGVTLAGPPDNQAMFTFEGQPQTDGLGLPRVVGAASLSNTSVMVVFNKPMADSALNPAHYIIVQEHVNSEVGALVTLEARFLNANRTTVILTTGSQNEVTYRVTVVNVQDLSGNELAPKELLVDPASATFPGTPPSGGQIVDSDGDGVSDNLELRGYVVTTVASTGEITRTQVTSDPNNPDTDGDGLDDAEERQLNTNPRAADSDGDRISDYDEFNIWYTSPLHQDTDADGLDDQLEIFFFKTSALLDDTDGDGLEDGDEVVAGNRDPRVSDLPEPAISIGEVALRLDTRFTYTDTEGVSQVTQKSNTATLTQSEQTTFATSDTETMKHVIEAGFEGGLDQGKGTAKGSINYNFTYETTFTASQESVSATQSEYQESLTTSVQRDITQEVTRTIEGASIDLAVSLSNFGDIPFTMNNLEITALLQDPFNRRRFTPVASLLPASQLQTGSFEVFLGPFIQERGPFIFKSTEVYPSLVEDLMKNPRGLIFKVANFDVVDEQGRNFAFISQDVNDRTAGLIIDYGNGQVDRYRIATHNAFDENGRPTGITMAYALQDILGLTKNGAEDAITVGLNGCAETFAIGDDIQVVIPVCSPVTPGGVIVEPGPNGVLETEPAGDDHKTLDGLRIVDGGDGCAHTRARRDDVQVVPGECITGGLDGIVILAGPNGVIDSVPGGDDELATVSGYGTQMIGTCDGMTTNTHQIIEPPFGGNGRANSRVRAGTDDVQVVPVGAPVSPRQVIIAPGPNGILESQPVGDEIRLGPGALAADDSDCPGGSVRRIERLVRVKGVRNVPEEARLWVVIGPPDMNVGAHFDELPLQAGRTYSLAFVQDQDMDGLYAQEEYLYGSSDRDDNSDGCPLGDGAPGCDANLYDFDTLRDFEEIRTGWRVQVAGQSSYVAFANPVQPDSDADGLFDDEELALGTDPGKRDTDGDGISDFDEVRGYSVVRRDGVLIRNVVPYQSAFIAPGQNGVLDSIRVGDDVLGQDGLGRNIITPGPNGILDSTIDKDDRLEGTAVILDGGNGIPETTASVKDVQVGPSPLSTRNVTITFVDFKPNGDSCDGNDDGEYRFNLRVRKGVDTIVGTPYTEKAVLGRFDTHYFGGVIADNGNGVCNTTAAGDDVQIVSVGANVTPGGIVVGPGPNGKLDTTPAGDDVVVAPKASYSVSITPSDTVSISAAILEDDPTCDADTRSVIAEPVGGNNVADTLAIGDDRQLVAFGALADAGETIVDSCPASTDGVLDTLAAMPGLCEETIIAGADGRADTIVAAGTDDVQALAEGTTGLPPDAVVIAPGPNGRIDTVPAGSDEFLAAVVPLACEPVIVEPAGGNGTADTTAAGDDVQVVPPGTAGLAAGTVIIRPGPNGVIDTTPDGDDAFIPSSMPPGGDCSACPSQSCIAAVYDCSVCPSSACYGDDVLVVRQEDDSCEAGWLLPDADELCPCGSCRQFDSTPTPSSFTSWSPQSITLKEQDLAAIPPEGAIVSFTNGPSCFQSAQLRVLVQVTQGSFVTPGAVLVRAGSDGVLDTVPFGDDVIGVPHLMLYASNPLDRDTDGDTLFDGAERILGANPNDARDAQRFRDNDLDGLPNGVEIDGWFLGFTDATGQLQCLTDSGTMVVNDEFNPPSECRIVTSDPYEPDSDFDGLPDLLEYLIRSDPRSADTDNDGLLDYDEFSPTSKYSIPVLTFREFERRCFEASRCVFTPAAEPHGTSVVLADTDQDGRTDREEIEEYWIVAPCVTQQGGGQTPGVPRAVYSSPLEPDFDLDGLPDGQERAMFLDPANPDTDGDGIVDSLDVAPDGCGKRVTVTFSSYAVRDDCDGAGDGEFRFRFNVITPAGDVVPFNMNADNLDDNETQSFPSTFTTTFAIRPGQTFRITGTVTEDDDGGDEVWNFSRTFNFNAVTGQQTISPNAGEANDGCFDDHILTVYFTVGQL